MFVLLESGKGNKIRKKSLVYDESLDYAVKGHIVDDDDDGILFFLLRHRGKGIWIRV